MRRIALGLALAALLAAALSAPLWMMRAAGARYGGTP